MRDKLQDLVSKTHSLGQTIESLNTVGPLKAPASSKENEFI